MQFPAIMTVSAPKRRLNGTACTSLLALSLLTAFGSDAWAQFSCGPGDTICVGSGWCEPITTPAARAMCPLRGGGGGGSRRSYSTHRRPQVQHGAARRQRPRRGVVIPPAQTVTPNVPPANPPTNPPPAVSNALQRIAADPRGQFLNKPLNCPRGYSRVGATFYGGTQCAPMPPASTADNAPSPAAGEQLPWDWPPETSPEKAGAPAGPTPVLPDDTLTGEPPGRLPPIPSFPPSPGSPAPYIAQQLADRSWPELLQIATGGSSKWKWIAVGGAAAMAVGFGGSAVVVPMLRAWPVP